MEKLGDLVLILFGSYIIGIAALLASLFFVFWVDSPDFFELKGKSKISFGAHISEGKYNLKILIVGMIIFSFLSQIQKTN